MGVHCPALKTKASGHEWHTTSDTAEHCNTRRESPSHVEQLLHTLEPVEDHMLGPHCLVLLGRQTQPAGQGRQPYLVSTLPERHIGTGVPTLIE